MKKWKSSSNMNHINLETGNSYLIKPKFKKSIWEIEVFSDTNSKTSIKKSLWRTGLFEVRISTIKEIEILHLNTNSNQNSNTFICSNDFKEFDSETFDCCEEIVEKEIEWDLNKFNISSLSKNFFISSGKLSDLNNLDYQGSIYIINNGIIIDDI
jgi:hypothetical protein